MTRGVKSFTTTPVSKWAAKQQKMQEDSTSADEEEIEEDQFKWSDETIYRQMKDSTKSTVLPLLEKLGFRMDKNKKTLVSFNDGHFNESFADDREIQQFLLHHGIPTPSLGTLTKEETKWLRIWVAFANVPLKDITQAQMEDRQPLTSMEAKTLLQNQLGLIKSNDDDNDEFVSTLNGENLGNLNYIRCRMRTDGLEALCGSQAADSCKGMRRLVVKVTETQLADLRLWAAKSPFDFPLYPHKPGNPKEYPQFLRLQDGRPSPNDESDIMPQFAFSPSGDRASNKGGSDSPLPAPAETTSVVVPKRKSPRTPTEKATKRRKVERKRSTPSTNTNKQGANNRRTPNGTNKRRSTNEAASVPKATTSQATEPSPKPTPQVGPRSHQSNSSKAGSAQKQNKGSIGGDQVLEILQLSDKPSSSAIPNPGQQSSTATGGGSGVSAAPAISNTTKLVLPTTEEMRNMTNEQLKQAIIPIQQHRQARIKEAKALLAWAQNSLPHELTTGLINNVDELNTCNRQQVQHIIDTLSAQKQEREMLRSMMLDIEHW